MHVITTDAALRLAHEHLDALRREATGRRLARRRRHPVSPPAGPPPGGGWAA